MAWKWGIWKRAFKGDHGDMVIIIIMGMEFGYWFKTSSTNRIRGTSAFLYLVV
jgi:hypothetical protein